ncbi:MAG: zinc-ribbon domain-containing protein [Oscillospiraceae bacterium]
MILSIYKKAFAVLMKRPIRLWGVSLLCMVLAALAGIGFAGIPAIAFIIAVALEASMAMIYLNSYRTGLAPKTEYLFSTFHKDRFLRVVGGMAWMYLWVFLWSLIPIVGIVFGVVRAYEYRFTPYILMTREDVKPTEAIRISKKETMGYKGKMFGADIFATLAYLLVTLVLSAFGAIPYIGVLFVIVNVLLGIAWGLLSPLFFGIVAAAFYVEIHSHPAQSGAPAPAAPVTPAPVLDAPAAEPGAAPAPAVEPGPAAGPAPEARVEPETPAAPEAEAPSVPPQPAFCTNCGASVQPGEKFCTRCGHKL